MQHLARACLPLALVGCQTIIGADFGSAQGPTPCQSFEPPKRPANLSQASDTVDFTVVIDQLAFGDESDAGSTGAVGFDLDGLCTVPGGTPSCKAFPWLSSTAVVDGPGGRDDAVGNLFLAQKKVFGGSLIGSAEENDGVASGTAAPAGILRVRGFSGLGSDDHVVVELFQAASFASVRQPGKGGDGGHGRPSFDASDQWPLVRATLVDADSGAPLESTQRDDNAFVLDSTLVAHFDELRLPMHNIYVDVSKAMLSGHLGYNSSTGWTISNGTLGARIRSDFLLGFVPLATRSAVNVTLCTDDVANYQVVKKTLCEAADLPEIDGDPSSHCAFTSLGVGFQSSPASLGNVVDVPPTANPCPPETDPANDTCARP